MADTIRFRCKGCKESVEASARVSLLEGDGAKTYYVARCPKCGTTNTIEVPKK